MGRRQRLACWKPVNACARVDDKERRRNISWSRVVFPLSPGTCQPSIPPLSGAFRPTSCSPPPACEMFRKKINYGPAFPTSTLARRGAGDHHRPLRLCSASQCVSPTQAFHRAPVWPGECDKRSLAPHRYCTCSTALQSSHLIEEKGTSRIEPGEEALVLHSPALTARQGRANNPDKKKAV